MSHSTMPSVPFAAPSVAAPVMKSHAVVTQGKTANRATSEQAVVFGSHHHLVGVFHPTSQPSVQKTAAIFITPGMLHSAGPFRLHVDLASTLGSRGVASLRFDLSGIGESLPVGSAGRSLDRASAEISQAIDWLQEQHGIQQVILFGLCSGADDSLHAAQQDQRVCGIVAMDACGYPTSRFHRNRVFHHYLPRLASIHAWKRLTRRVLNQSPLTRWLLRVFPESSAPEYSTMPMGTDLREYPSREIAKQEFQRLVDQGCRLHLIYTGGVSDTYNYAEQFFDMLPGVRWKNLATVDYFPQLDHVAILCEDRQKIVNRVAERIVDFARSN
ncbi:alpha/beta fold hydrolase [Rhodopirellula sp. P2]|uniref:alpha/beta fold hydrolase n=1 Tax=Rhodopirellula sp. P2 TaxID=2127060 RepID=UPI0023682875|nr:alpha/beta fold hydrolase [Rhodopirellula sp. P2]WDQ18673.1 alpha/beta hydrolase [Rhodopirellula sp. P2]